MIQHALRPVWAILSVLLLLLPDAAAQTDPGVRPGASAGGMRPGLTAEAQARFAEGQAEFVEIEGIDEGFGPRFNLDSCGGCHTQPAIGGTSPARNPQMAFMTNDPPAAGQLRSVVETTGPIVEVRFKRDGSVHQLFAIDEARCDPKVGPFPPGQVSLRIPTPVFGAGLLEEIPDAVITAQLTDPTTRSRKAALGIGGVPQQVVGGRIGRFGWKAQHGDLEAFAAEAYNVEMGITSAAQPVELEQDAACQFAAVPNSVPDPGALSAVQLFAAFMRGLAAPPPGPLVEPSASRGPAVFAAIGCDLCHTPTLGGVPAFSDLLLHRMGTGLEDHIAQGTARGDEFRTAPLWGLGQRIFFLHDGRTADLGEAITAHASPGSEANGVITVYQQVLAQWPQAIQALLDYLRSL